MVPCLIVRSTALWRVGSLDRVISSLQRYVIQKYMCVLAMHSHYDFRLLLVWVYISPTVSRTYVPIMIQAKHSTFVVRFIIHHGLPSSLTKCEFNSRRMPKMKCLLPVIQIATTKRQEELAEMACLPTAFSVCLQSPVPQCSLTRRFFSIDYSWKDCAFLLSRIQDKPSLRE